MAKSPILHNLEKVSDSTLGCFSSFPTSDVLDHAVRYLSTWSGSEKFLMIVQYALKLVVPFLNVRARLQHRSGLRKDATSSSSVSLSKLAAIISDSRMLWRFWGLLPIYQWLTTLERAPPPTRRLLTIERLQGWSMLAYYPLEHLYYLRVHSLIPASIRLPFKKTLHLDTTWLGLWSTRFWALYVILQLAHLREDGKVLKTRERVLTKDKGKYKPREDAKEGEDLKSSWNTLYDELVVNLGYLPLTIHWSLKDGLFSNEIWEGVLGLVAGLASCRAGWKATALPSAPIDRRPPVVPDVDENAGRTQLPPVRD